MSIPASPHLILNTVVRDIIRAAPAGTFGSELLIVAQQDTGRLVRPCLIIASLQGRAIHPRYREITLVLRLRARPDDTAAATAATWHATANDHLLDNLRDLYDRLLLQGWILKKCNPGEFSDTEEEDRGRIFEQAYNVQLEHRPI
jgi:hypothetical protein